VTFAATRHNGQEGAFEGVALSEMVKIARQWLKPGGVGKQGVIYLPIK